MSSDPTSDEQPEVDDGTLSEVVRRPTRTAGDLSEVAEAAPGITTEDLASDREAAAKTGEPSERELLLEILWRLRRIEEHLGLGVRVGFTALPAVSFPSSHLLRSFGR
jgi:hypothetical protein